MAGIKEDVLRSSHGRRTASPRSEGCTAAIDAPPTSAVLGWSKPPGPWFVADLVGLVAVRRGGEYGGVTVVGHSGDSGVLCWLGMHDVGQKGLLSMVSKRNGVDNG
jgi:hypothetical protein